MALFFSFLIVFLSFHSSRSQSLCINLLSSQAASDSRAKGLKTQLDAIIERDLDLISPVPHFYDGKSYRLRILQRGGPNDKPVELLVEDSSGMQRVLLSSNALSSDRSSIPFKAYSSPKGDQVLVKISHKANTDRFELLVLDFLTGKILDTLNDVNTVDPRWFSDQEFTMNPTNRIQNSPNLDWVVVKQKTNVFRLKNFRTGKFLRTNFFPNGKIIHSASEDSGGNFVVLSPGSLGNGEIHILNLKINRDKNTMFTIPEDHYWIKNAFVKDDLIYVEKIYGENSIFEIWDFHAEKKNEIKIPVFAMAELITPTDRASGELHFLLSSPVHAPSDFYYDLSKQVWKKKSGEIYGESDLRRELLTLNGIEYEVQFQRYQSKDGTEIPLRYTYRKDLKQPSPALLLGYGGYGRIYHFYPEFEPLMSFFLQNGGVVIAPALRGGSYLGGPWAKAGQGENKGKVAEDLLYAAKAAIGAGLAKKGQIISVGFSHGGLIAAQAMQMEPDLFGLVILQAAPLDLLNKAVLDGPLGPKARSEYGDIEQDSEALKRVEAISPLQQLTPQRYPKVLIIAGNNDTRVNSDHSQHYFNALQIAQQNVELPPELILIQGGGHKMKYINIQGWIGYYTLMTYWKKIYDWMDSLNLIVPPESKDKQPFLGP